MKVKITLILVGLFMCAPLLWAADVDVYGGETTFVIHNFKSTPIQILGRKKLGGLCSWGGSKQKWTCSARDIINTGETVILWNKPGAQDGYAFIARAKKYNTKLPAWQNEGWDENKVAIKAGNFILPLGGQDYYPQVGADIVVTDIGISYLSIQKTNVHPSKMSQREVHHY